MTPVWVNLGTHAGVTAVWTLAAGGQMLFALQVARRERLHPAVLATGVRWTPRLLVVALPLAASNALERIPGHWIPLSAGGTVVRSALLLVEIVVFARTLTWSFMVVDRGLGVFSGLLAAVAQTRGNTLRLLLLAVLLGIPAIACAVARTRWPAVSFGGWCCWTPIIMLALCHTYFALGSDARRAAQGATNGGHQNGDVSARTH